MIGPARPPPYAQAVVENGESGILDNQGGRFELVLDSLGRVRGEEERSTSEQAITMRVASRKTVDKQAIAVSIQSVELRADKQ